MVHLASHDERLGRVGKLLQAKRHGYRKRDLKKVIPAPRVGRKVAKLTRVSGQYFIGRAEDSLFLLASSRPLGLVGKA